MSCRITLVLEYSSVDAVPRIGANTPLTGYGEPRVCAMQFSDALRELEVLEDAADEATKDKAFRAAYGYPGCTDPGTAGQAMTTARKAGRRGRRG